MSDAKLTELGSGVRVVTEEVPSVRSVALGLWVRTGSRNETPAQAGVSHFLEHLLFKGTARYDAIEISERFDGLGLEVAWHGASRIALPQHVLDAFLFSISESLENVRRHAGVTTAHVTVTEGPTKVTAMITDAGRGFLPDEVSEQRLGIKESVIGRLAEVGGAAKVFSSPGAGTTVLLEVPR